MHILIIPSEEYVPLDQPMSAIFQHDQAKLLLQEGYTMGALSFSFPYSLRIFIKSLLLEKHALFNSLNKVEVLKLLIKYILQPFKSSLSTELKDGVNIVRCKGVSYPFYPYKGANQARIIEIYGVKAFKLYCKKYGQPDLIHTHGALFAGHLGNILSKKHKIPHLLTEGGSIHVMGNIDSSVSEIAKCVFQKTQYIQAVSPSLKNQLESLYNIKKGIIQWSPNVIPKEFESISLPQIELEKGEELKFLNVANLIPLKGQKELIYAFSKALTKIGNARLDIVGGGFLHEELVQLVNTLNLSNNICIHGYKNRKEVLNMMSKCNAFVLPSHYETFGVVLIEALALGKPVLATSCGGPECIVNESNGYLVQPKDVDSLSEGLIKVYTNYHNFSSKNIRKEVLSNFGMKNFIKKIKKDYIIITNDYNS